MTNDEPVLGHSSSGNCYLVMSEFTNNPAINKLRTGIVTYDDKFESLFEEQDAEIVVRNYIYKRLPDLMIL